MPTRNFALIIGIAFLAAGILGFVPGITRPAHDAAHLSVDAGYGYLVGLFPVNVLHNLVHLVIGIWGIAASRRYLAARAFCRSLAVIYGVFAVMGLIPALSTTFGLVPLFGHDIWLHAITALAAAYFGFVRHEVPRGTVSTERPVMP